MLESCLQILPISHLLEQEIKTILPWCGYITQEHLYWPFAVLHGESFLKWFGKSGPSFWPCKNHKGWNPCAHVYPCILSVLHIKLCGVFGGVIKAKNRGWGLCPIPSLYVTAINNLLCRWFYWAFVFFVTTTPAVSLEKSPGWQEQVPVIDQGLFMWLDLPTGCRASPSVPCIPWQKGMSQWHGGSPWGWEALLICISGLPAHTDIFGEQRIISLTQMTFSLLCHREENQALNLESCRRSMRSPLACLQCVSEGNENTHGPVIW